MSPSCTCYPYSYGNAKDGEIAISRDAVSVTFYLSEKHQTKKLYSADFKVFSDAVKKALLLYMLHYSKPLILHSMTVTVGKDNETEQFSEARPAPIYSLITQELKPKLSEGWQGIKQAEAILSMRESKADSRLAALFALLCANSQEYETDRFVYNWMAINGMYNYLYSLYNAEAINSIKTNKKRGKEYEKIQSLLKTFGLGEQPIDTTKSVFSELKNEVLELLVSCADEEFISGLTNPQSPIFLEIRNRINSIAEIKDKHVTPYGLVLLYICYSIRCNTFHANSPVALLCYAEDTDLKQLRVLNKIMSGFLKANLHLWFDNEYVENRLRPAVQGRIGPINPFGLE